MKLITLILGGALLCCATLASAQSHGAAGKSYGGVRVTAAGDAKGAPGSPLAVQLDFAGLPASGASVTYAAEGALKLASAEQKQLTPDSHGVAHDTVIVSSATAGLYYLNVFTATKGVRQAVSVPVTVGTAVFKPRSASSVATPGGASVIEMPAQQTVR